MGKRTPARTTRPAPARRAEPPRRRVPPPTMKEIVIAALLAYVKLPLVFYPFAWALNYTSEDSIGLILAVLVACLGVALLAENAESYVIRLRGQLTSRHFSLMYLAGVLLIVLAGLGLLYATGSASFAGMLAVKLLLPVTMLIGYPQSGLVYLGVIAAGVMWLISTRGAQKERCKCCGGYAYKDDSPIKGTYRSQQTGESTTVTTELEDVHVDQYGVDAEYRETTTTTKTYAYTEKRRVVCRHCGMHYGDYQHSGTFDDTKSDSTYFTERH